MIVLPPQQCPQCKQTFTPGRRNQNYCSTQCRADSNNEIAKSRYNDYKEDAPRVEQLVSELKALREYMATLTAVIDGVREINSYTIAYNGRAYVRTRVLTAFHKNVGLMEGGGLLLPNDRIIYKMKDHSSGNFGAEFLLDPHTPVF